jgi:hypothetical protein
MDQSHCRYHSILLNLFKYDETTRMFGIIEIAKIL